MKQMRCSDVFVFAGPCSGVSKATVKPVRSALAQQKGHKQGQKASGTVNEISTQQYHNI